ncbi:hypothetical protein CR513_15282, partial [Mucuna pruriens]
MATWEDLDLSSSKRNKSKLSRTNPKGPKKIWVPKPMIVLVAYVFNNKETLVIVLTSHDGRRVYVPRPQFKEMRMGYLRRIDNHPFLSIDNVLYVKRLKHNLLGISQLCDSGYDVCFNKGECIVKDCKGSIIFSAKRQNNLYKIDLTYLTNQKVTCLVSINDDH